MRLIDADTLPIVTRCKNHHRKYVFADITDAPTILAIPVEWLRSKIKEHTDEEGWQDYIANSFGLCIEEWQKEQEAR